MSCKKSLTDNSRNRLYWRSTGTAPPVLMMAGQKGSDTVSKQTAKVIAAAVNLLEQADEILKRARAAEVAEYDSLPESVQMSERGWALLGRIRILDEFIGELYLYDLQGLIDRPDRC